MAVRAWLSKRSPARRQSDGHMGLLEGSSRRARSAEARDQCVNGVPLPCVTLVLLRRKIEERNGLFSRPIDEEAEISGGGISDD